MSGASEGAVGDDNAAGANALAPAEESVGGGRAGAGGSGGTSANPMMNLGMVEPLPAPGEPAGMGGAGAVAPPSEPCTRFLRNGVAPPSVLILADRSGSMFQPLPGVSADGLWYELRTSALAVVQALAPEVRFGFAAFAGSFGMCPSIESVVPVLDNLEAIQSVYGALASSPELADSGTLAALQAAEWLLANAQGNKFIWLLTDGEADYCNDGNPLCPVDSVVGKLQELANAESPVRTLVSGMPSLAASAPMALQAFADAGRGGLPALPAAGVSGVPDNDAIYDLCSGVPEWAQQFANSGKPNLRGQTTGNYAASSAGAPIYSPFEDPTMLSREIRSIVLGDRSCSFDLAVDNVPPSELAVLNEQALLEIDNVPVPYDAENGWHRVGATGIDLEGEACAALRAAATPPALRLTWNCSP